MSTQQGDGVVGNTVSQQGITATKQQECAAPAQPQYNGGYEEYTLPRDFHLDPDTTVYRLSNN